MLQFIKKYSDYLIKASFLLLALVVVILIFKIPLNNYAERSKKFLIVDHKVIADFSEVSSLRDGYITPVVYRNLRGLNKLDTELRKQKFVEIMLPAILIAKYELKKENIQTIDLWGKLKAGTRLTASDSVLMERIFKKYKTKNFAEINLKQQLHPNSIILAQAALETGWGTSRFFIQGNNSFGIWSYNSLEDRIPSSSTRGELKIYLKKYDNILESVQDYFRTIATSWAYDDFRKRRAESDNAYELIWYLNNYSELRNDYVKLLGDLMISNQLSRYDTIQINPVNFVFQNY